ncbi:MAG TPA: DNA/RNA nuclease SfsA [Acidobacteriota bacterium]|nr:DNA/RNA nuclease SfsA [Acidobacteriota bacterium]
MFRPSGNPDGDGKKEYDSAPGLLTKGWWKIGLRNSEWVRTIAETGLERGKAANPRILLDPSPRPARFLSRLNRFLLACELEPQGPEVLVHLPNSGRLGEILHPGTRLWLLPKRVSTSRKTAWTAALAEFEVKPGERVLISLDTMLPNDLVAKALDTGLLPELQGWKPVRREFFFHERRFDFLLGNTAGDKMLLEVKSVSKVVEGYGFFPDAVTERGRHHLELLADLSGRDGWSASVLFVVQRPDALAVTADEKADAAFTAVFRRAMREGVRFFARRCRVTTSYVELGAPIPVTPTPGP